MSKSYHQASAIVTKHVPDLHHQLVLKIHPQNSISGALSRLCISRICNFLLVGMRFAQSFWPAIRFLKGRDMLKEARTHLLPVAVPSKCRCGPLGHERALEEWQKQWQQMQHLLWHPGMGHCMTRSCLCLLSLALQCQPSQIQRSSQLMQS